VVGLYGNLVTAGVSHPGTPLTSDLDRGSGSERQ
jgi:hypothetical protein